MDLLQLSDIYRLVRIMELRLSADGRMAAFTAQTARRSKDDYALGLYVVPSDGSGPAHLLSRSATVERGLMFSPDGRYLGVIAGRPDELELAEAAYKGEDAAKDDEEPKGQVWVYDLLRGGEPRQLTTFAEGVEGFTWSPDGRRIAVSVRVPTEAQVTYLKDVRKKKGPIVTTRAQHKLDGVGYLDDVRTHLFLVDVDDRAARQITDGPCDEKSPVWSPDGNWIMFASNRTGDADQSVRDDLWLVRPDGSEARRLTHGDLQASEPVFSPEGDEVAFVGVLEPENLSVLSHLLTVRVADAIPVADLKTEVGTGLEGAFGVVPDRFEGDPVANARRYPKPLSASPVRHWQVLEDRPVLHIYFTGRDEIHAIVGDRGQNRLVRALRSGEVEIIAPGDRLLALDRVDVAGGVRVAVLSRDNAPQEVYRLDPQPVRLSTLNAKLASERRLATYQWVQFPGWHGEEVEALVTLPPDFRPGIDRAPLLAQIHGGPQDFDTPTFDIDNQYFASRGFIVVQPNYHGSTSYGEAFCTVIRGRWGPIEHQDLMAAVEHVIGLGWADPDRLYCTGFSYGGMMTNWAVGHTGRFRAVASEHGLYDYRSCFGEDDCHLWWQDDLGVPWQNAAGYEAASPASSVENMHTPMLITAGNEDWRCPLSQAEQLYLALKKRGVPTELVIYQGEHHTVSRPRRAIDRLRRIVGWLGRYGGPALDDQSAEGYAG